MLVIFLVRNSLLHPSDCFSNDRNFFCTNSRTGTIWANVIPTTVYLATYFVAQDWFLFVQCSYYKVVKRRLIKFASNSKRSPCHQPQNFDEHAPLLSADIGLPGSHRRASTTLSEPRDKILAILAEQEDPSWNPWIYNTFCILMLWVTGTILWYLAYRTGMWRPMPLEKDLGEIEIVWEAETLGWISAFCYFL